MSALGQAIRTRRRALNLSQTQVGKLASLATSHICQIETGKSMPGVEALQAIAKALDVPAGDFMAAVQTKADVDLRDRFAGLALHAMLSNPNTEGANAGANGLSVFPGYAYEWADAMLKARAV